MRKRGACAPAVHNHKLFKKCSVRVVAYDSAMVWSLVASVPPMREPS
jgi:hypothetical protein